MVERQGNCRIERCEDRVKINRDEWGWDELRLTYEPITEGNTNVDKRNLQVELQRRKNYIPHM